MIPHLRDPLIASDTDVRAFKTMIVFSLGEGPGQLFKALAVFALRDLDLLKIESRPLRRWAHLLFKETMLAERNNSLSKFGTPLLRSNPMVIVDGSGTHRFNYLFYVDFVGKLSDEKVQNAMRHLQEIAPYVRVLGSFPMDLEQTNVESMFHLMRTSEVADDA